MELQTVIEYEDEFKVDNEFEKSLCRSCLSAENRLLDAKKFARHFKDFADIDVLSDSLPPFVCHMCVALLLKAVRLKHKMLRAQTLLYEYIARCAPFPIAGSDPELNKYASPHLQKSHTLSFDIDLWIETDGFHQVLQHEKSVPSQTDLHTEIGINIDMNGGVKVELDDMDAGERGASDAEDDIPLQDYKTSNLESLNDIKEGIIKTEPEENIKKRKKKEHKEKKKKKTKEKEQEVEIEDPPPAKSIRKPIEIDPNKIRTITLNAEEQLKAKEELSKSNVKFPYQCHLCYKGFNFELKLQNHMNKHSPSRGPFSCSLCSMYFPTNYSHLAHSLAHTTRYECRVCARTMTDRASIYNHYRSQHEGITTIITCPLCGKMSSNDKTHRGHMRNHHSGARPECDLCGKSFVNRDSLTEHMQIHDGVKNYECSVCGKRCRTRAQISAHQLKHGDVRPYYCVECDVRFKTAHTFRQHLRKSLRHCDVDTLKYPCLRCPKRYPSAPALETHTAVAHEGLRPHSCLICGAALSSRGALRKHEARVHGGKRPAASHVCDACGKAFRAKSVLTNHLRTHTGEKPYKCDTCARPFAQRTAMLTHVRRVHSKPAKPKLEPVSEADRPVTLYTTPKLNPWHPPEELFYVTSGP